MKTTPVIFLMLLGTLITLTIYFYFLHGEVSSNSQDWASFGNYLSGVLMPLLASINIWVFIRLTQTINHSQNEFQKNESTRQNERHRNELEQQRRIIITQMRQNEITLLTKTLDNSFIPENNSLSDKHFMFQTTKNNLLKSTILIDSFLTERQPLFPLEHNSRAYKSLIELHKMISEIHDNFDNLDYEIKIDKLLKLKHNAIQALYQFTTDNIIILDGK